ncbi:MAG: hypothetical protein HN742_41420 [Lentisphaerae bacterium]|jgi:hypothetical protein|nr:hypothetical protein [Lentisphaerota bacterium]MBT4817469.1 hypothetical protein [Lentisphaerota bacterium]MBT5612748.1 hypothetical protein [Lentisphaerota bacterium]MBT7058977.1 hypothetical protein [Lentisphaerota bacterium]MBT7848397.1 hypothetical protein [Lentisphaerota bacterium]
MQTARDRFMKEMASGGEGLVRSHISVTFPVWEQFGDQLDWLGDFSEHVAVGIRRISDRPANSEVVDRWGCHWTYPLEALDGICDGHPLAEWSRLTSTTFPDPAAYTDWEAAAERVEQVKRRGGVASGGTEHGFFFLRMTYLRGFENFLMDVADSAPRLQELIRVVEEYWLGVVRRWVDIGVDIINFGDDLGLQYALPMSPEHWRKIIKPTYRRLFGYCREHGVSVGLHSDGYIVDIIPDLLECGVSVLNPQDLVNGLDALSREAKGKAFLRLDVDRQAVTVLGTPEEVDTHILACIRTLGSPQGGLGLIWGVYPGTPLANIESAARAMDRYATHWCGR